jgi:hypothetical protein
LTLILSCDIILKEVDDRFGPRVGE